MRQELRELINKMSDEELMSSGLLFSVGGGARGFVVDDEGFPVAARYSEETMSGFQELQTECWHKFNTNPQVFTAVDDTAGYLAGAGFGFYSEYEDVQLYMDGIITDSRNRLYSFFEKWVLRSEIEGELFIACTVHRDGFCEFDFIPPSSLVFGSNHKGIIFHPRKSTMPIGYVLKFDNDAGEEETYLVPSIYMTEFPDLMKKAIDNHKILKENTYKLYGKTGDKKFSKFHGHQTFIMSWDKSLFTDRNTSHLRTVIEWANHYEELKRYEIDHKRSSGSYLWIATFDDIQSFRRWMSLSEEEVEKTGFFKPKTPGGTLILPPGMTVDCKNPNLTKISDSDTDIMQMVISGLNRSEDMVTGTNKGTYAAIKASRGPEADRKDMKTERWRRFLVYDFWRHIFRIKATLDPKFKLHRNVKKVVGFDKNKEPKTVNRSVPLWESLEVTFPFSESVDFESATKGLLGVKHGSLIDTLGIPPSVVAQKLGFKNYTRMRLQHAEEMAKWPELALSVDADSSEQDQENSHLEGADKTKRQEDKNETEKE
jgi:hypothetical protein